MDRHADRRGRAALGAAACAIVAWALFRTAWMCDDAFITLRTIDNFVHGYGLRWNAIERAQAYTHPLWLMLLTPFYAMTREPYFTTLAVQSVLALATVWLLVTRVAASTAQAWVALAMLVSSKAFVDFSTSGLENPLTHLLLLAFFVAWRSGEPGDRRVGRLAAIASGIALCRPDLTLLVVPALVMDVPSAKRPLRRLLIGAAPLMAWELFSLVYYGSLVPNTALAKLATGIPAGELFRQGLKYWQATAIIDPMTVAVIVVGGACLALFDGRAGRLIVAGAFLHALFIVRSGGDFMSGRFLTGTCLFVVLGLAGLPWTISDRARRALPAVAAGIAVVGLFVCDAAPLISSAAFGVNASVPYYDGVDDERQVYYPAVGLLRRLGLGGPVADDALRGQGEVDRRAGSSVQKHKMVGIYAYYAGPAVYVVDQMALGDPFLARMPAIRSEWRIGHFERVVTEDYMQSRRDDRNELVDPHQHDVFDRIRTVTEGPIWSLDRLRQVIAHPMW